MSVELKSQDNPITQEDLDRFGEAGRKLFETLCAEFGHGGQERAVLNPSGGDTVTEAFIQPLYWDWGKEKTLYACYIKSSFGAEIRLIEGRPENVGDAWEGKKESVVRIAIGYYNDTNYPRPQMNSSLGLNPRSGQRSLSPFGWCWPVIRRAFDLFFEIPEKNPKLKNLIEI